MKDNKYCIFAVSCLFISITFSALADKFGYRELPLAGQKAVQKNRDDVKKMESFDYEGKRLMKFRKHSGNGGSSNISDINVDRANGKTAYEIQYILKCHSDEMRIIRRR